MFTYLAVVLDVMQKHLVVVARPLRMHCSLEVVVKELVVSKKENCAYIIML